MEFCKASPRARRRSGGKILDGGVKFDYLGCFFVGTGLACLEVVLDEGERNDWFGSTFIVVFAVIAAASLVALVVWEWGHEDPLVDVRLIFSRHFGACFAVMLGVGAILITTTQFLPQLLQSRFGYNATLAGVVLLPGGLATLLFMPVGGILASKVQPKYLIAVGMGCAGAAMLYLTRLNPNTGFSFAAWSRIFLGVGLPFMFIPITSASYDGLPPGKIDQASGLINVARNLGGSIGVSLAQTLLAQRNQFHQSRPRRARHSDEPRLSEHAATSDKLLPRTWLFSAASRAAGDRLDRAGRADAGRPAGLHRRVLDACYPHRRRGRDGVPAQKREAWSDVRPLGRAADPDVQGRDR